MLLVSVVLIMLSVMASFESAQYDSIQKQLAADVNVLLTAARVENGHLVMPDKMPDERFNEVESEVLGVVYDMAGQVLWRSRSTLDEAIYYSPDETPNKNQDITEFGQKADPAGNLFFYDLNVSLDGIPLVFVTLIPATEYLEVLDSFRQSLFLWLMLAALGMLLVVWFGMHWSLQPINQLAENLLDIEQGKGDKLSGNYPRELSGLTNALNLLLANERKQREKYRDSMADLAHSLKTPLAVLQSMQHSQLMDADNQRSDNVVEEQVQRMNQIISYQLQRAVTRQKGLIKNHIDVNRVIDRITNTLNKVYRDKQVELSLSIEQGIEFTGDEQDLMEVLGNLLENAYRLCLQKIKVTAITENDEATRESLVLIIEDDGPGIPVDRRQDILKRGVRADSRTPGQGIGLAVAIDIIDSYEGCLTIDESELGGALFQIEF